MAKIDYYELLEVERDADSGQLKRAYRTKAMHYHPDRNPDDPGAEEQFKLCSEAYEVLNDPQKRQIYDQYGHEGLEGRGAGPGFGDVGDIFTHFSDIFGDLFGGGGFGGGRRRSGGATRGADLRAEMEVSLQEAAFGIEKELEISHPSPCGDCHGTGADKGELDTCGTCGGQGQVGQRRGAFIMSTTCPACRGRGSTAKKACGKCEGAGETPTERTLRVNIPGGVDTGQSLRLAGQGQAGRQGGPSGHLYVTIYVARDERFERDGHDLLHEIHVSYPEAALGTKIQVPVLHPEDEDATEKLKIPSGTQPGEALVLRGKGVPRLDGRGRGDLICVVRVDVPKRLSRKAKKLLEQLTEELQS